MADLPDWSDLPDDLRTYAQRQPIERQRGWADSFAADGYTREQVAIMVSRYQANDAEGAAIAGAAVLTPEQEAMSEADFFADLIARQDQRERDRQAARAAQPPEGATH